MTDLRCQKCHAELRLKSKAFTDRWVGIPGDERACPEGGDHEPDRTR